MLASARRWIRGVVYGTSLKRRLVILRLLATGPKYGTELIATSRGELDYGNVYLELAWMEHDGYVTRTGDGEYRYTITDAGRALLTGSEREGTGRR